MKVVLKAKDFSLYALMIELPSGKQQTTFMFEDIVINDFWAGIKGDFDPPKTPGGWKHVTDPPADAPTANGPPPADAKPRSPARPGPAAPPLAAAANLRQPRSVTPFGLRQPTCARPRKN